MDQHLLHWIAYLVDGIDQIRVEGGSWIDGLATSGRDGNMNQPPVAVPEYGRLSFADPSEATGELLVIPKRNHSIEGQHRARSVLAGLLKPRRVCGTGRRYRIGDLADTERTRPQQIERSGVYLALQPNARPISGPDVFRPARKARTAQAVAENDVCVPIVVQPHNEVSAIRPQIVKRRKLLPPYVINA